VHYSAQSNPENPAEGLYADYYRHMTPFIERLMGLSFTTPESVAVQILKVIRRQNPPLWIPATLDAKLFYYLRRFIPRRLLVTLLFSALPGVRKWARQHTKRRGHLRGPLRRMNLK